jgi:hypothetical protein
MQEGNGVDLIFHANTESGKTDDLQNDPDINLGFLNNSGEWASVSGKAEIVTDREMVHKYYSPALKAWIGDLGDGKHDGMFQIPHLYNVVVLTSFPRWSRRPARVLHQGQGSDRTVRHSQEDGHWWICGVRKRCGYW